VIERLVAAVGGSVPPCSRIKIALCNFVVASVHIESGSQRRNILDDPSGIDENGKTRQ
jgi:hypothetical protein